MTERSCTPPVAAGHPAPGLTRRHWIVGAAAAAASSGAWSRPEPASAAPGATIVRQSRPLMGTVVTLVVDHADPLLRAHALERAWEAMSLQVEMMSRYRSASRVSALAQAAGGQAVAVDAAMRRVLQAAHAASAQTEGRFDITVGAYDGWQFDSRQPQRTAPALRELRAQRPLVDFRDVLIDERAGTARLARPGMKIDLGGIAKLPILQAGLDTLRRHGIAHALVDGGGDALALGRHQGRPWRIGVRDPRQTRSLLGVVELDGGGVVASSGDYERFLVADGRRLHHVIDPATGMPGTGLHGVTFIASSIEEINGLGAAAMVAGVAATRSWLARRPDVEAVMVDSAGTLATTTGLHRRLRTA